MKLSEEAQRLLRCPTCTSALITKQSEVQYTDRACNATFRLVAGLPIMLNEDRASVSIDECFSLKNSNPSQIQQAKAQALRLLPSLDLNRAGKENIEVLQRLAFIASNRPVVVNIGGKHPSSASANFCQHPDVLCFEIDQTPLKPRTNIVAEPDKLPLESNSVDVVILDGVLEHLLDPRAVVAEAHRVLKKTV